jgi:uncharacterized metal-binding protein
VAAEVGNNFMSTSNLSRWHKVAACAKCGLYRCRSPDFASKLTGWIVLHCAHETYAEKRKLTVKEGWSQAESKAIFAASDEVLVEGYGKWCRVKEVIEYSKKMGYRKLGLAFCVALRHEARILQNMLEANGFDVISISCMAGAAIRNEVGFEEISGVGKTLCNPLMQAEVLNENETELNIMAGLCVGHDVLFIKHSKAGVTPLVVKDRVLQHNPAAALGTRSSRFRRFVLRARRLTMVLWRKRGGPGQQTRSSQAIRSEQEHRADPSDSKNPPESDLPSQRRTVLSTAVAGPRSALDL